MRTSVIKTVAAMILAATVGLGVAYAVHARHKTVEASSASIGMVSEEPRVQIPGAGTRWPMPMLTPSV